MYFVNHICVQLNSDLSGAVCFSAGNHDAAESSVAAAETAVRQPDVRSRSCRP